MIQINLKNLVESVEKYSPKRYSVVLILPILTLTAGFLVWSIYLYSLGFIISDLLRARFILTGILFVFITVTFYFFTKNIIEKVCNLFNSSRNKILFYGFLSLFWLLIYSILLFPRLPLVIGGGQPKALGLIVINEDDIELLKSLDFKFGDGAEHQTENVCVAYDGSENLLILRENRVISLNKSSISGFVSLPGINATIEQICILSASNWALKGFFSSIILSISIIYNSLVDPLGLPMMRFFIE
ncbi:MAG: hypothetical protein HYT39_03980 [Candidatus Sungbacteria bacterium]|nr:hypothetical protein [Candidatus Sungbacteria bacterium]